ncbi:MULTISPECIES: tripartite tricarboxylate transporter permease [Pontibacillus]|uniref:Tripartite tricarboxylate transporter permease n=1 Tax=Pontibacillus chungwhensis TaxID=265426 RepID=A0ABY8UVX6_9BACI|nr:MULTISPECIES: tripartite tricarboxylate transporter permease [Pontibacillus]MCD5325242.1 tripartite tricarboxylate transporter permease [Pontibacillus sp. HN14]WIF97490.1 tripartite tricarboxylate transporter permease [Pontibacillus chungwhensis]
MFEFLPQIINALLQPINILLMIAGVVGGIVVGALPGLTTTMALALLLPFTFTMSAETALITLGGLYIGGIYGGCISAILINTPGTPSAIATTFDGYPLTKKGMAEKALKTAAISSGIGGVLGGIALLFLTGPLATLALRFGPPEYFWIAILGLTMIATLSSGSLLKGLIGGGIGLMLSTIGLAPVGGEARYSFGFAPLQAGLELIVVLIAFFCLPEVIGMVEKAVSKKASEGNENHQSSMKSMFLYIIKRPILVLRSSIIGFFTGIIPGAGGNVAALLSYDSAVRFSKNKNEFGKGNVDGVVASESSNNSEVGGSLVPLLALGIPGAPPAAIMLGALMIQGIRPGPNLFVEHGALIYTFLISFIIANVVMLFSGIIGARYIGKVLNLPTFYLAPSILFLTIIGAYAIRNNVLDVFFMLGFGILAYYLKKVGFNPAPIVLGLILGPIAEEGLAQSIMIGGAQGNIWGMFFGRPISLILIIMCIISLLSPLYSYFKGTKDQNESDSRKESRNEAI